MSDERPRPVVFGEVLFDRFPDGSQVLGGAPFNVAWNLAAFGARPLFVSRVGGDSLGDQVRDAMVAWGMSLDGLQLDPDCPTGTVEVSFEAGEPAYEIVPDRAWDRIDAGQLPEPPTGGLLYHGSLALRSPASAAALSRLRDGLGGTALLDVNLRDPWWHPESVRVSMSQARWIKLNEHELVRLVSQVDDEGEAIAWLMRECGAEHVVVTHGEAGATAWSRQGERVQVAPERAVRVVDTVGAGDAFASVLMLGCLHEWPLATTLKRAQSFAAAVVGLRGATVRDPAFYQRFTEDWGKS